MSTEQFANNASTTLNGSITNVATTITVRGYSTFPSTPNFRIKIDTEIMLVTAGAGSTTWTVTRAQENTDIASHSAGDKITHVLTAGGNQQFVDDRILNVVPSQSTNPGKFLYTDGSAASWQYAINLADVPPSSPGLYDEEFNGTLNTLPTNWAWTVAPSGSDAWYVNKPSFPSWLLLYGDGNTDYFLTRSTFNPTGDFGIWCKCMVGTAADSVRCDFRMYVYNSGKTEGRAVEVYPPQNDPRLRSLKTNSNAESAWSSSGGYAAGSGSTVYYLGLTRSSSNVWRAWGSMNGFGYQQIGGPETHSFTVDKIVFSMSNSSMKCLNGIDWIRYRSDLDFPLH
jgi:hypothetical protein